MSVIPNSETIYLATPLNILMITWSKQHVKLKTKIGLFVKAPIPCYYCVCERSVLCKSRVQSWRIVSYSFQSWLLFYFKWGRPACLCCYGPFLLNYCPCNVCKRWPDSCGLNRATGKRDTSEKIKMKVLCLHLNWTRDTIGALSYANYLIVFIKSVWRVANEIAIIETRSLLSLWYNRSRKGGHYFDFWGADEKRQSNFSNLLLSVHVLSFTKCQCLNIHTMQYILGQVNLNYMFYTTPNIFKISLKRNFDFDFIEINT